MSNHPMVAMAAVEAIMMARTIAFAGGRRPMPSTVVKPLRILSLSAEMVESLFTLPVNMTVRKAMDLFDWPSF